MMMKNKIPKKEKERGDVHFQFPNITIHLNYV